MTQDRISWHGAAMLVTALAALAVAIYAVVSLSAPGPRADRDAAAPPARSRGGDRPRPTLVPQRGPGDETLSGQVRDAGGSPVAGVSVTAAFELGPGVKSLARDADAGPEDALAAVVVAITDADGRFSLEGVEAGRHRLRVEGVGILTAEVRFVDAPGRDVQIIVSRAVQVAGTVLADGAPVADVEVRLQSETMSPDLVATSDAGGAFTFDEIPEGRYRLWAIADGRAAPAQELVRIGPGTFAPVTVVLVPAETVRGRVVDGAGRGVSARVTLTSATGEPPRTAVSGADGHFSALGVLPGRWTASAEASGYLSAEAVVFTAGREFSPTLVLVRGAVVEGVVVDGAGVPIAGATVALRGVGAQARDYTGDTAVDTGAADADPRFIARGELGVLLGPIPYPPPPGTLAVRVAAPVREPSAQQADEPVIAAEMVSRFVTDFAGTFRITGVSSGRYQLAAIHDDFAPALMSAFDLGHGATSSGHKIELRPGVTVNGEVTSDGGAPVVGATVTARPVEGERDSYTVTGTDGRYRLGPFAGPVVFDVVAVGYATARQRLEIGPAGRYRTERELNFRLDRAVSRLEGQVIDERGVPVRGAVIKLVGGPAAGVNVATSESSGRFTIPRLADGSYQLQVEHTKYPTVQVSASTGSLAEVRLPLGGGIEVAIRDAHTGAAIAGAHIEATGPQDDRSSELSDDRGRATLVPLVVGAWIVEVEAAGYGRTRTRVAVPRATEAGMVTAGDVVVELSRGARLRGVVRDEHGNRLAGATASVGASTAVTDEQGQFELVDVAAGKVTLVAEKGGRVGSLQLDLQPGDELVTLEVTLDGGRGQEGEPEEDRDGDAGPG